MASLSFSGTEPVVISLQALEVEKDTCVYLKGPVPDLLPEEIKGHEGRPGTLACQSQKMDVEKTA